MRIRKILTFAIPIFCLIPLAYQFVLSRNWFILIVVGLNTLLWFLARKNPTSWYALGALFISVGLFILGWLTAALPYYFIILGVVLTLANWDLVQFEPVVTDFSSMQASEMERNHYRSLIFVLIIGLIFGLGQLWMRISLPFGVVFIAACAVLYSLDRIWRKLHAAK